MNNNLAHNKQHKAIIVHNLVTRQFYAKDSYSNVTLSTGSTITEAKARALNMGYTFTY